MTQLSRYYFWGWLILITLLSASPTIQLPHFDLFSIDKLAHAFFYGVLAWLARSVVPQKWGAIAFSIGYGAFMEYVQYAFVPGRFCEFDDMIANALGAIMTLFIPLRFQVKSRVQNK